MYIFYDLETSGLERDFSQILQIGLIFTDDELNILASKKLDCRRSPWVVPSPGALLTTGFTPDDLKNSKNSHFELMQEVDQWARSQYWPVIFSGYNTIGYDEDILAQNFHMNLLDPGMTSARSPANGERNRRVDVMIVAQAVQAYMPGALKLDVTNKNGAPSMKLGVVAEQNGVGLSKDEAHDAMNDIKATVGVAKVCKKAAPQVWEQMHALSTADGVSEFISKNKVFTHTKFDFGVKKPAVVTSVTTREGSGLTEILFDLQFDPAPYMAMTAEQLKDVLIDQTKKQPKGAPPKPDVFRLVRKTAQPILMPMELSDPVLPPGFDEKLAEARADAIKANAVFQENLAKAAKLAKEARPERATTWTQQPEEFIFEHTQAAHRPKLHMWMEEFRAAPSWKEAAALVTDFYKRFETELQEDPNIRRFVKFAGRIVFEHAPEELSEQKQQQMNAYIAAHILSTDNKVPWMTVAKARKELDKIEKERLEGEPRWAEVTDTQIRSLKLYYTAIEKEYAPFLRPVSGNDNAAPATPATPDPKRAANDRFRP